MDEYMVKHDNLVHFKHAHAILRSISESCATSMRFSLRRGRSRLSVGCYLSRADTSLALLLVRVHDLYFTSVEKEDCCPLMRISRNEWPCCLGRRMAGAEEES